MLMLQYCKAVNKMETPPPPPQHRGSLRSFLMFGFSANQATRSTSRTDDNQSDASTLVRRSSRVNVNVAPAPVMVDTDAPEIRKYKKRFSSDVLCASLWGMLCFADYIPVLLFLCWAGHCSRYGSGAAVISYRLRFLTPHSTIGLHKWQQLSTDHSSFFYF